MNSFNRTNVGNSIIKAIPAPEAKAPLSPKIANAIPTIKGPIVWPIRKTMLFIDMKAARSFIVVKLTNRFWTDGTISPCPNPKNTTEKATNIQLLALHNINIEMK